MPIKVACECGLEIVTRDEYAGRRAQCKKCKRVLTIPGKPPAAPARKAATTQLASGAAQQASAAPPTLTPGAAPAPRKAAPATMVEMQLPKAPATMHDMPPLPAVPVAPVAHVAPVAPAVIRYRCVCGSLYQSNPDHAGKPVRCPACAHIQFVPRTSNPSGQPSAPASKVARSARLGGLGFFLAVLVVLLLGAGMATALYYGRTTRLYGMKERDKPRDFKPDDFIPDDTLLAISQPGSPGEVDLMTWLRLDTAPHPDPMVPVNPGTKNVIERTFIVVGDGDNPPVWRVLITRDPIKEVEVVKQLGRGQESTVQGHTYFATTDPKGPGVYLAGEKIVVFGEKAAMQDLLERLEAQKDILAGPVAMRGGQLPLPSTPPGPNPMGGGGGAPRPPTESPLRQSAKRLVQGDARTALLHTKAKKFDTVRHNIPADAKSAHAVLKSEVIVLGTKGGPGASFEASLFYANATEAQIGVDGLKGLDADALAKWLPNAPADKRDKFLTYLHQKPTVSGSQVRLQGAGAEEVVDEILMQLMAELRVPGFPAKR